MSIFFNIGRNPNPDYICLDPQFITIKNLKHLISNKIGIRQQDMRIKNVLTSVQYALNQYIRKGSSVNIQITAKNLIDEPLKFHQIITNQHLNALMSDCRFYIVKSSNQDNIQKARQCSIWATTFLNQQKFKNAFQCYKHVFFLFGTNRSFQLKGLARMQGQPQKIPDKAIWNGVGNIRLGGNFKIRWIRKKPLSLTTIQRKLGPDAKDQISKATDGYQPDKQIAKKVALLFQLPSQPYYKPQDLIEDKKQSKNDFIKTSLLSRPDNLMASQLASVMMKKIQQSSVVDQLGIFDQVPPVVMRPPPPEKESKSEKRQSSPSPRRSKKKSKKDKKSKKKKHKKESKKKRYQSSSSSSRSRSRSSSISSQKPRKRRQKHQRIQKRHH